LEIGKSIGDTRLMN